MFRSLVTRYKREGILGLGALFLTGLGMGLENRLDLMHNPDKPVEAVKGCDTHYIPSPPEMEEVTVFAPHLSGVYKAP